MMSTLHKKIEVAANVAIVVVALLLGYVLVQRYLLSDSTQPTAAGGATAIKPGAKLSLPGVDWNEGERTLLMVLSTNCHFCTESAPFYQKLAQEKTDRRDVKIVAVLPQGVEDSQKYLSQHGIKVDDVRQAPLNSIGVPGTPTLILVDGTGSVIESWVGKLPPGEEAKVLNRFLSERGGDVGMLR